MATGIITAWSRFRFLHNPAQALSLATAIGVALLVSAPAVAVPTGVTHADLPTCDFLAVPPEVDELGTAPFPSDELISSALLPRQFLPACAPTDSPAIIDQIVDITNLTMSSFDEVWYVADPETTITNVDGLVNGELAFRIDMIGVNAPLISEVGGISPGVFEPGETWTFILQDFANTRGISPAFLGSFGVPSPLVGGGPGGARSSSGSIVAVPEPPTTVSFAVEAGLGDETLNAAAVRPADAVDTDSGNLEFSAFPDSPIEDIDAYDVLPNGHIVFSTSTDVTQGFGGLPYLNNGDVIEWAGSHASILFDEELGFGGADGNIDAFAPLPNGNWLLSTDLSATLGGLSFDNGDIVEYDPVNDVATLYMGLDEASIFTGAPQSNADIDALHVLADGRVIFSIRSNGIGQIGNGLTYSIADEPATDLFALDPMTGDAIVFLDGDGLFDGETRNLDAVSLPEPSLPTLLGAGIVALVALDHRRRRRERFSRV